MKKLDCLRCNGVGLVEANRLRINEHGKTIAVKGSRICPYCDGKGRIEVPAMDFRQLAANDK